MKKKILKVIRNNFIFFLIIFEASILGALLATLKLGKATLQSAYFLRRIYIIEAIKIGSVFGIIVEFIVFGVLLLYEIKKDK